MLLYAGACRAARLVGGAGAGPGTEMGHGSPGGAGVNPLLLCDDGRQLGFAPPADALLSALADPALPAAAADEILALLQHQARAPGPPGCARPRASAPLRRHGRFVRPARVPAGCARD